MKCSPLFLTAASCLTTIAAGQALSPTAHAQPPAAPSYHVRLDWQKARAGSGGLIIWGRVTNTGTLPLTYTQVTPTLIDHAGQEVFRGRGYLTSSPLLPGASAEFRACEMAAPRFASLRMVFCEAGQPVLIDPLPVTTVLKPSAPLVKTAKAL